MVGVNVGEILAGEGEGVARLRHERTERFSGAASRDRRVKLIEREHAADAGFIYDRPRTAIAIDGGGSVGDEGGGLQRGRTGAIGLLDGERIFAIACARGKADTVLVLERFVYRLLLQPA